MMHQVRVNVRCLMNVAAAKTEQRNGREVIIVPSATLPDDVIMNGVLYPADEIEKSFRSLNRTPAPLGHPIINDQFVSASDPEGINRTYIGAWNENARRENGRVFLDTLIDTETAGQSQGGRDVLKAINKGDPIHTSTGLVANLEEGDPEQGFTHIARDIIFDHNAILLGEDGAATPDQGVGLMVNGEITPPLTGPKSALYNGKTLDVINAAVEMAMDDVDWAGRHLLDSLDRLDRASMWDKLKPQILKLLGRAPETKTEEAGDMANIDEQIAALVNGVKALGDTQTELANSLTGDGLGKTIGEAISKALEPVTKTLETIQANEKAKTDQAKTDLVNKLVAAGLGTEEELAAHDETALTFMASKMAPGKPHLLNAGGNGKVKPWADYDMNANLDEKGAA